MNRNSKNFKNYTLTVKDVSNILKVSQSAIRMRIKKERDKKIYNDSYKKIGTINLFDISYIEKELKNAQ